jgi:hypothetical protein
LPPDQLVQRLIAVHVARGRGWVRHADRRQRITELLGLIAEADLSLADLDVTKTLKPAHTAPPAGDLGGIPEFLRRNPAPADAAGAGSAPPAAGESATTKH